MSEKNDNYFAIQPQLIGLYTRDRVCLLRGTKWILNTIRLILVFKWLKHIYKHEGLALSVYHICKLKQNGYKLNWWRKHDVNLNDTFEIKLIPPRKQSVSIKETEYLILFMEKIIVYSEDYTALKKIKYSAIFIWRSGDRASW